MIDWMNEWMNGVDYKHKKMILGLKEAIVWLLYKQK
jgi:hypothetical protein